MLKLMLYLLCIEILIFVVSNCIFHECYRLLKSTGKQEKFAKWIAIVDYIFCLCFSEWLLFDSLRTEGYLINIEQMETTEQEIQSDTLEEVSQSREVSVQSPISSKNIRTGVTAFLGCIIGIFLGHCFYVMITKSV